MVVWNLILLYFKYDFLWIEALNKLFECFSVPSVVWHHLHEILSRFLIDNMLRDIFIKSVFLNCKIVLFVLNNKIVEYFRFNLRKLK